MKHWREKFTIKASSGRLRPHHGYVHMILKVKHSDSGLEAQTVFPFRWSAFEEEQEGEMDGILTQAGLPLKVDKSQQPLRVKIVYSLSLGPSRVQIFMAKQDAMHNHNIDEKENRSDQVTTDNVDVKDGNDHDEKKDGDYSKNDYDFRPSVSFSSRSRSVSISSVMSELDEVCEYRVKNALIGMIGIGDYPKNAQKAGVELEHLVGIPSDYKNMIKLFVNFWNYTFIYQLENNNIQVLTKNKFNKHKKSGKKYATNFKINWNCNEINNFVSNVRQKVVDLKPDCLIFIVSSHGDKNNVIYDSELNKYKLSKIWQAFWNQDNGCPFLANKPKIMIVDACQGTKIPLASVVSTTSQQKSPINVNFKGSSSQASISSPKIEENDTVKEKYTDKTQEKDEDKEKEKTFTGLDEKTQDSIVSGFNSNEKSNDMNDIIDIITTEKKVDDLNDKFKFGENALDYENTRFIFGNLKNYAVLDGGKKGGFLIRGIKSVLLRDEASDYNLDKIVKLIRMETYRLSKGQEKQWKSNFKPNENPIRQIVEDSGNMMYDVYFEKNQQSPTA